MRKLSSGGGWQAIRYSFKMGKEVGYLPLWRAMRSHNACKTCALGMGGQLGGMTNEARRFPEVCKKSFQAMAADMRGRIEPGFFSKYSIKQLQDLSPRELEMCGRIVDPIFSGPGDTHYRPISWPDAIAMIGDSLKNTAPDRSFFYASGRSSNEAGFLMQLLARVYGTNHVNNCSYYCHQASGEGLKGAIGVGTATVTLEDVEECDLLFLIGGNPASNHPRLMTTLMKLRNRGGKVVVVNPVRELGLEKFKVPSNPKSMLMGTEIASTYVQLKLGGDIAFLAGVAKALIERGAVEKAFIDSATEGFCEFLELVEELSWEQICADSGLEKSLMEDVARQYAASDKAIFSWTMGITHHEHGVQNVQWIVNLALMRGMLGKEGAGVMPIRGHSNVQGIGTIGVSPAITKAAVEGLEKLGVKPPTFKGHDTLSALEAAEQGEVDFAFCLGGNLYGASPDATFCAEALSKIELLTYLNTTLNTGHAHGLAKHTLILPVLARDEEKQSTTQESMFSYVRLSDGGITRHEGLPSEVDVIADVAERALGRDGVLDWSKLHDHDAIRALIAKLVPTLAEIETIGQTKKEFHIPGRALHTTVFPTQNGKATFHAHPLPVLPPLAPNQLRLMTVRSEGQFNTVVYDEFDLYRNQERRDVVLINEKDLQQMGLKVDQRVNVVNETGRVDHVLVRTFDIAEGAALMYYPESNALVSRKTDPKSRTPAFKNALVTIEPVA